MTVRDIKNLQHCSATPGRTVFIVGLGWMAGALLVFIALLIFCGKPARAGDNNLNFDGTLVADPCTLDPSTTDIELDFGTVIDKYLYLNTRTHSQPFVIRLLDCDLTLGKMVNFTFSGTPDKELNDLLALSRGPASGVAIGIELPDGKLLPLNKPTPGFELMTGTTELIFKGFVQGEPTALQNHSIVRGEFTAVTTFTLDYP